MGLVKLRQDLKEAPMSIPILKMDAEYSSETSLSIIFTSVEPLLFLSTAYLSYNDLLFYVILIFYNFSKRNWWGNLRERDYWGDPDLDEE
jgi:hypothetical protein